MRLSVSGRAASGWATVTALAGLLVFQPACGGSSGKTGQGGTSGSGGSPAGAGGRGAGGSGAGGAAGGAVGGAAGTTNGGAGGGAGGSVDSGQPGTDASGAGGTAVDGAPGTMVDGSVVVPDTAPAAPPPWVELTAPGINFQGGAATSAGGLGQPGGSVHLVSRQNIVIDMSRAPAAAPVVPAPPADAVAVATLAVDLATPGTARVGDLTSAGTEPVRTIAAAAGDLFITGSLRSADLGTGRQAIRLSAPAGTVYVSGSVDTSGGAGGKSGGAITITALRVVITGRLDSSGADGGATGGAAGAITITAEQSLSVTGGLITAGGNAAAAGTVVGGRAGDVTLQAGGDLVLAGTSRLRGGAAQSMGAEAQGGAAASLLIRADASVLIGGILDARGGLATAAATGGRVAGGAAGALKIGDVGGREPASVTLISALNATGGSGQASGGRGGSFRAEPLTGNVTVQGARAIDVSGAGGSTTAGAGGTIFISARQESSSGGVDLQGEIFADGGNVSQGGAGAGAAAGRVELALVPQRGTIQLGASGKISAVGGRAGGASVAGAGGQVSLFTNDGDLTIAGAIVATGGAAPDAGGTGGLGGKVILWSDQNGNANQVSTGNLLIATTGLVEASGGAGTVGGSARNDGIDDSVAGFPAEGDKIAILIDCDNVSGTTLTWLENRGRLVARGGASNGHGGDIMFHGRMRDGQEPLPGNIDNAGNGTGRKGDFGSE